MNAPHPALAALAAIGRASDCEQAIADWIAQWTATEGATKALWDGEVQTDPEVLPFVRQRLAETVGRLAGASHTRFASRAMPPAPEERGQSLHLVEAEMVVLRTGVTQDGATKTQRKAGVR